MTRRLWLLFPVVLCLTMFQGPASFAGSPGGGKTGTSDATASTEASCKWVWHRKKVVRWVRRHGKLKKVVRFKRVKVRVCEQVPPVAPARLGVRAYEFGFTLSATELLAGDTIVELNNQGEDAHDLHIQRIDGGEEYATPETDPLTTNRIRFDTSPGTYRLWCSLPNHANWGMDTTISTRARS